jgi:hypothetical protein
MSADEAEHVLTLRKRFPAIGGAAVDIAFDCVEPSGSLRHPVIGW